MRLWSELKSAKCQTEVMEVKQPFISSIFPQVEAGAAGPANFLRNVALLYWYELQLLLLFTFIADINIDKTTRKHYFLEGLIYTTLFFFFYRTAAVSVTTYKTFPLRKPVKKCNNVVFVFACVWFNFSF